MINDPLTTRKAKMFVLLQMIKQIQHNAEKIQHFEIQENYTKQLFDHMNPEIVPNLKYKLFLITDVFLEPIKQKLETIQATPYYKNRKDFIQSELLNIIYEYVQSINEITNRLQKYCPISSTTTPPAKKKAKHFTT